MKAERTSRILDRLGLKPGGYILATIHRAENTDDRLRLHNLIEGFNAAADTMPVVLPLHPRTRHALKQEGMPRTVSKNFLLIDPVGYLDMVML
jgi:UDP-GlcNAc3NAcA epimerase